MKRLILLAFLICSTAQATNAPFLAWYAQDQNGKAMPGAKLYFYSAGGLVAKNVYSDETCAVSLGSSLTADGAGRFRRFYMGALNDCSSPLLYKVVFKTAGGSTVWTEDNVASTKTNLAGIVNASSATATAAVTGTNTNTGYGVSAVATASTNHALNVEGKLALPESAAVHIVPQQNTPSVLAAGDLWFDSVTGRMLIYDGTEASQLMFAAKAVCTATTAAGNGLTATGNTTGAGVSGTGGATAGAVGVLGTGGAGGGVGVYGVATGTSNGVAGLGLATGNGVSGTGGATSGAGLYGTGGAPNGNGATVIGDGTGSGINATGGDSDGAGGVFTGGATNASGIEATGSGSGDGITAVGGTTSGIGVYGEGGTPNGIGGQFQGSGTGTSMNAFTGGDGYACSCSADATTPVRASLRIVGQDTAPSSPQQGDIYYNTSTGTFYGYASAGGAGWKALH